jgi:microcystin-dependent protein
MPGSTTNYAFNLPLVNDPIDADLWGGQLNANWTSIDSLLKTASDNASSAFAFFNLGDIKITSRSTAPARWLFCRGQAISRATYAGLFAAIGTTYGSGDGSTTFNVPDLGGRVVAGLEASATRLTSAVSGINGAALGASGGNQNMQQHTHTATVTDPGHQHQIRAQTSVAGSGGGGGWFNAPTAPLATDPTYPALSGTTGMNSATTGITVSNANAGTGSSQNVQPTIVLNYLIYAGV